MTQWLIKLSRTIFSDVRRAIIGIILVALLGGTGGVLYLSKTLLHVSIDILKTPTPLWATIALVLLCCVYIYSKRFAKSLSLNPPKARKELIKAGRFLWETTFESNNILHVSKVPFCKIHELRLTELRDTFKCMEKDCKTSIECHLLPNVYKIFNAHRN